MSAQSVSSRKIDLQLTSKRIKRLTDIVNKFSQVKLLVIGDFILDEYIWGNVSRISPEAPVPVVDVQKETVTTGGALNVGNNIKMLGAIVYPCGLLGRDLRGRVLTKILKNTGIDVGGVICSSDRHTTLKTRVIAHSQQVVRFDRESKEDITTKDIKAIVDFCKKKIRNVHGIIIEDYGKGVIVPELLRKILPVAKKYNKFVAVDPKEKHLNYYKGATIITPNKKEAYTAAGVSLNNNKVTVEHVGHMLRKKIGCQAVLMTLGEEGMALCEKDGSTTRIPTVAHEVFDVSGAGDTVIAVLSMALGCGADFLDAAIIANFAAGVVVGKVGTACVTKKELLESFNQYKE